MTTPASATGLAAIDHAVVLMRENRWLDHLR
jgi:phospholipase C